VGLAQFVNQAKGDPSQLMVNGITMVGAILTNKSPVTLDQVTPIARLTGDPLVIVVPANSPIKSVKELADAVKADPAKVTWAGGSAGGADHILAALFAKAAGSDPSKVNYIAFSGGGEALAAMLGGRVTAGISGYGEFESQIKAGKLRALAISSGKRLANADVPTLKEQGLDVEVVNWRAIVAGPDITAEQKKSLTETVEKVVESKEWAEILKQRGWEDFYLAGEPFTAFLKEEQVRVGDVLKSVGLVKS
jgi:putative tricarboxylic transport membrane protein